MKKQIEKLIILAKSYQDFAIEAGLPNESLTPLRGYGEREWVMKGDTIRVYLSKNYSICSVYLDRIEVSLYSNMVHLPFDADAKYLDDLYTDCLDYLNYLHTKIDEFKAIGREKKEERIARLKEELISLEA